MENHFEFVEVEPLAGLTGVKVIIAIPGGYAETVKPLHVRDNYSHLCRFLSSLLDVRKNTIKNETGNLITESPINEDLKNRAKRCDN